MPSKNHLLSAGRRSIKKALKTSLINEYPHKIIGGIPNVINQRRITKYVCAPPKRAGQ